MKENKPLSIIVGAGEGLGLALALELDQNNYQVVGINRSNRSCSSDHIEMMQVDASDDKALNCAIEEVIKKYGIPEVLIHNTAQLDINSFDDTSKEQFELAWHSMVLSAFNAMKIILPYMVSRGKGTIVVSGATASLRAGANFSAFASAKFALRGLTQSVAREYQKQGIHIAHVILDGILDTPNSRELHSMETSDMMSTSEVAEAYMQLIEQKPSAWTHELDLRPKNETF